MKKVLYLFFLLIIFFLSLQQNIFAEDIIVNGTTVLKKGGKYEKIIVLNNGTLNIVGNINCSSLVLEYGTVYINGNLFCTDSLSLLTNPTVKMTVAGDSNIVNKIFVHDKGNLIISGKWNVNNFYILGGGNVAVNPNDKNIKLSGFLFLNTLYLYIAQNGHLGADGAGNDPRGKGKDWYADAGGGSFGGAGGHGWWDASVAGDVFGEDFTYEISMGSAGGNYGGGCLDFHIDNMEIHGRISSNGATTGGSGGGILLTFKKGLFASTAIIEANGAGGKNSSYAGGGGGRIKAFYYSRPNNKATWAAKGFIGNRAGKDGTVYFDYIPEAPKILLPLDNAIVKNINPTFSFTINDSSLTTENKDESLLCRIELSLDNFKTLYKIYDQSNSVNGWSQYSYKSGQTVKFTPSDLLGIRKTTLFKWRSKVQDKSLFSDYSLYRNLTVIDTTVTVSVDNKTFLPAIFSLEQNYPNPFNPNTTIKYSIPNNNFVSLKVYDVLGKEVAVLVDENKPVGIYEVKFKACNLPSGIYIYKIQTGNFVQNKKMVLIK